MGDSVEARPLSAGSAGARDLSALRQTYASVIETYLSGHTVEALREADNIGRSVGLDAGVLGLLDAYHAALARAAAGAGSARDAARVIQSAAPVISESLRSFEQALSVSVAIPQAAGQPSDGEAGFGTNPRHGEQKKFRRPEAQSDVASAIHADAVDSLAAVAVRIDLLARQLDDREAARSIEKLKEAVITAHSRTVSLADVHEGHRVPALVEPRQANGDPAPPQDVLTEREREILSMISAGATNADIADRLVISQSTVKSHVKNILRKLGVRNRTHAAARYFA